MSDCLQTETLKELASSTLTKFDERIAHRPAELCAGFHSEARTLEAELLTIHRLAAICVRNEVNLDKIASVWASMVKICDDFAQRLASLNETHPNFGAHVYYDRILDLRNKCRRLEELHK